MSVRRVCLSWVLSWTAITAGGVFHPAATAAEDSPRELPRVLIVTGEDYPGHKWRETAPVLKEQLAKDPRWSVEMVQELAFLRTPQLHQYQAIVMHFKNYDPQMPGPEGQENLEQFVRNGGGLVIVHFACGAFQEWPQFVKIAGRVWNPKLPGHDKHGKFRVEVVDTGHPITQGMTGFETTDELYTCLEGDVPITVLAESQSNVDKKQYAMAFVLDYGKGRVFHSPLGHDAPSLAVPAVGELFRRGCAWVLGLPPAPSQ